MKCFSLSLFAFAVLVCACSEPLEKKILGTYKAQVDVSGLDAAQKGLAPLIQQTVGETTIEFKPEGKGTLAFQKASSEVTWDLKGTTLTVHTKSEGEPMLLDASDPQVLKQVLSENQKKQMMGASVSFKRQ